MLAVPGLNRATLPLAAAARPLALAANPPLGDPAAILGYPRNGPFDARAGRIGRTQTVVTQDAYGRGPVSRLVTPLRGVVRPGNSGGPMVDATRARGDHRVRRHHGRRSAGRVRRGQLGGGGRSGSRRCPGGHRSVRRVRPLSGRWATSTTPQTAPAPPATLTAMSKTLVIAEKPSVGRDLARVLPGPFQKHEGWLDGPEHVITWAVGHLVQLAEPDEYDPKYKKWRMADLPIVPARFKLVVRDERSRKQMSVVTQQLGREDVGDVVNACDAGREGELIFAYLYEKAKGAKPVRRLWLSSMTNSAMKDAFARAAPGRGARAPRAGGPLALGGRLDRGHERDPRGHHPPALVLRRRRLARPRADPDAGHRGPARGGDPRVQARALLAGRRHLRRRAARRRRTRRRAHLCRALPRRRQAAHRHRGGGAWRSSRPCRGVQPARSPSSTSKEQRERAPLLYDLTSLQRDANTRFGFSARRTLAAAQRLYEEHKALTYPRTSSRYLTTDMVPEIKPTAELVGGRPEYAQAAAYVVGLDLLPLGRVVDDSKVSDHHAIIPTRSEHKLDKMSDDDRRVYDMVTRRFLAVFHPEAVFENTRVETTVSTHVFRTRGKLLLVPGWRGVYGELSEGEGREDDEGTEQQLPRLVEGENVQTREITSERKETKPPRRYSDASLLGAMETAGKLVDDDELREAMKDSGIGTPATRAAIIERLIDVGYIERDGRSLVATEKGLNVIRLLGEHALTSPDLTGQWEHRLGRIERGEDSRERFMKDIAGFAEGTVHELDAKLKDVRIPRANLGPCPVCGHDIVENRKGYSCWSREDPGCGFVIWKSKAGKQLPLAVARELIKTGYTARPVTGFRGRSGRSFRARLALSQTEDGKWRVEFNEPWAREGAKPPEAEPEGAPEAGAELVGREIAAA